MDCATLSDGRTVALAALPRMLPAFACDTHVHADICDMLANIRFQDHDERRMFANLLTSKSAYARQLTCLAWCARLGHAVRASLSLSPEHKSLTNLIGIPIDFAPGGHMRPLLDRSACTRFALKALVHRLYRLVGGRYPGPRSSILRTSFELHKQAFAQEYRRSHILIYPFFLNVRRGLRYVRSVLREHPDAKLTGIPFRWRDIAMLVAWPTGRDARLTRAELFGYIRHGRDLAAYRPRYVGCSDDVDAGGFVLAEALRSVGSACENRTHGIGKYAPYTAHTHSLLYSAPQIDYYSTRNPDCEYRLVEFSPLPAAECANIDCIVYVGSNFARLGFEYDVEVERRIIAALRTITKRLRFSFFVKIHPNLSIDEAAEAYDIERSYLTRQAEPPPYPQCMYFSFTTTAYFELARWGPFYFVDMATIPIEELFGEGIPKVAFDELAAFLASRLSEASNVI